MYLEVPDFLTPEEIRTALDVAKAGEFEDGRATIGGRDDGRKENEQLRNEGATRDRLVALVTGALSRRPEVQAFTQAAKMAPPMLSRYRPGKYYGPHQDAPFMGAGDGALRRDLSMTVFLADPGSYEGGALVLQSDFGDIEAKPEAGTAVIYSTGLWHEVEEVTQGERLALVSWFQSRVRDPGLRAVLYDVTLASAEVGAAAPDSDAARRLQKVLGDLTRRWSEA